MDNKASSITRDINRTFCQDISLHTLIHQQQAKSMLLTAIDYFYTERSNGNNPKYPTILMIGKTATTIAHAASNSFGNSSVHAVEGAYLGNGVGLDEFLLERDPSTTYYIHRIEQMNKWLNPELSRVINQGTVRQPEKVGLSEEKLHPFDKLIICSVHDLGSMDDHLVDSFDVVCRMTEYTPEAVCRILEQRLAYLSWETEPSIPATIAGLTQGDVKMAIRILRWSYQCARIDGNDVIKAKNLNKALHKLK